MDSFTDDPHVSVCVVCVPSGDPLCERGPCGGAIPRLEAHQTTVDQPGGKLQDHHGEMSLRSKKADE
jgi:hypothetical protein